MITGVILCGGSSTRMGSDKGMLQNGSQTWAQIAFNKLRTLEIPVVVSINKAQYQSYKTVFHEALLVTDNDTLNIGGPMKGIFSVHLQYPQNDLLVLAVDMLNMSSYLLQQLYSYPVEEGDEAVVYKHEHQTEPLCGIYQAAALNKVFQLYAGGRLTKHSMHFILGQLRTVYIDVPIHEGNKFTNFNSTEDLKNL